MNILFALFLAAFVLSLIFGDVLKFVTCCQVKLPFEKLLHAFRNFPEEATDPDVLLPIAFTFKVMSCFLYQMLHYVKPFVNSSCVMNLFVHVAMLIIFSLPSILWQNLRCSFFC